MSIRSNFAARTARAFIVALIGTLVALVPTHGANAAVYNRGDKWPADPVTHYTYVPVCVDPASNVAQRTTDILYAPNPSLDVVIGHVRDALRMSWELYSSVRFVGWGTCGTPGFSVDDHVSLFIDPDTDNSSLLGPAKISHTRDGMKGRVGFKPWGNGGACIQYDWGLTLNVYKFDCVEQYAIHEFGHVIGFEHEWRNPATPSSCSSTAPADEQPIDPSIASSDPNAPYKTYYIPNSTFDSDSIMTYGTDCADVTGVRFGSPTLDAIDIQAVQAIYPPVQRTATQDVGVIPEAGGSCPKATEVVIYLDNEDDSPQGNTSTGWIGATVSNRNTRFEFCRVDGSQFAKLPLPAAPNSADYIVLKLGDDCPAGSEEFVRYFDDEDDVSNEDWIAGDAGPNTQDLGGTGTAMHFCLFRPENTAGSTMFGFPSLGFSYGVLAGPSANYALASGSVRTDDEDGTNSNPNTNTLRDGRGFYLSDTVEYAVTRIIDAEANTTLGMALVHQNHAPLVGVSIVTTTPTEGIPVQFAASGGDLDGDPLTFTWDFGDGTTGDGPFPTHVYADNGDYTATVTATDPGMLSDHGSKTVSVENAKPVVNVVASPIYEGGTTALAVSISDVPADSFWVGVDWADGSPPEGGPYPAGTTSIVLTHRYLDNAASTNPGGAYQVGIAVWDKDGGATLALSAVTVNNLAPAVSIDSITDELGRSVADGAPLITGLPVQLAASASDPSPVDTLTGTVDWGDGTAVSGPTPITTTLGAGHVYNVPGATQLALSVSDDDGATSIAARSLTVLTPDAGIQWSANQLATQLAGQPATNHRARVALTSAINLLTGTGSAHRRLVAGNIDGALSQISNSLARLRAASAADSTLHLDEVRGVLVQSARSIAVAVIDKAVKPGNTPRRTQQIATARGILTQALAEFVQGHDSNAINLLQRADRIIER